MAIRSRRSFISLGVGIAALLLPFLVGLSYPGWGIVDCGAGPYHAFDELGWLLVLFGATLIAAAVAAVVIAATSPVLTGLVLDIGLVAAITVAGTLGVMAGTTAAGCSPDRDDIGASASLLAMVSLIGATPGYVIGAVSGLVLRHR